MTETACIQVLPETISTSSCAIEAKKKCCKKYKKKGKKQCKKCPIRVAIALENLSIQATCN